MFNRHSDFCWNGFVFDEGVMAAKQNLVSYKEGVALLNKAWNWDSVVNGKDVYGIGSIYNAVVRGDLVAYGPRHARQVDSTDLLALFGPKKNKSA